MKGLLFILVVFIGCNALSELPEGNIPLETLETERYQVQYPRKWHKSYVKGYSKNNSLTIFRLRKPKYKSAAFTLILDIYETKLELNEVIESLIEKDYFLKNANILSIKGNSDFIEILFTYEIRTDIYKGIKRFYLKDSKISEISFTSKAKDFDDFLKYQKLFLGTFKLK